tara:strand:+ start:681 stop:881 length:201 start_codon:yes stop_codon:yes gene_type:complete
MMTLEQIVQEEVEWMFSDAEEVGSSDISICVRQILDTAQSCGVEVDESQISIRGLISDALCEMEAV